jgi:nucleoside-diphosphate-sugar epimerase
MSCADDSPCEHGQVGKGVSRQVEYLVRDLVSLSASAELMDGRSHAKFEELTAELVESFAREGLLERHPYECILKRGTPISAGVNSYTAGRCVLVTGAAGTIGSRLCKELSELPIRALVGIDTDCQGLRRLSSDCPRLTVYSVDICNRSELAKIWRIHHPDVLFHLAAEREPDLSEKYVRRATLANVQGTINVCDAAALDGCERVIHASTGKCRFVYDERIYPATKKLAEFEVAGCAQRSAGICWSCVRFHHVVENSIVERRFRQQLRDRRPLTVHLPPERSKHGQSAAEAVAMLLNAGTLGRRGEVFASSRQTDYFSVLELALYLIRQDGGRAAIRFVTPNPADGYQFSEFPGSRRSNVTDKFHLTHGFNTIETDLASLQHDEELFLVYSSFPAFDDVIAKEATSTVVDAARYGGDSEGLRRTIHSALWEIARSVYRSAPPHRIGDAIRQGVEADPMNLRELVRLYSRDFSLLCEGLVGRKILDQTRESLRPPVEALADISPEWMALKEELFGAWDGTEFIN